MSAWTHEPTEKVEQPAARSGRPWLLTWVVILLCLGMGYGVFAQYQMRRELNARFGELNTNLSLLRTRTNSLEDRYAELKADSDLTTQKVGVTEDQLARARTLAQQFRKEGQRNTAQLKTQLEQQQNQIGSLNGTVGEVQGDVADSKQKLETTMSKLDHAVGDLGVQSGLIAHTRDELEELRRRGERDYFEFDLHKSKEFSRVGDFPVRLVKADPKRNKYTMSLLVNDKRIDKKDKTLYEPVQFYPQKSHNLMEIVVWEVGRDRVAGYLSVPKEMAMRHASN